MMSLHSPAMTLLCDKCDFDLRAQPADGRCPECGLGVAESREAAKTPRRPAWLDSDRWWRWRMLAGLWVLVLLPLPTMLDLTRVSEHIPLPSLFGNFDTDRNLHTGSLLSSIDPCLTFFIGTVLLFGPERHRRPSRRDWLKRWGIVGSCVVTIIGLAGLAFLMALVGLGISALFLSLPPENQPAIYGPLLFMSDGYMRYGPHPGDVAYDVQPVVAALVVLLACVPIYDALRAVGLKKLAWMLPAPLAALAIGTILTIVVQTFDPQYVADLLVSQFFFQPAALDPDGSGWFSNSYSPFTAGHFMQELLKWSTLALIAVILTIAQFRVWRHRSAEV